MSGWAGRGFELFNPCILNGLCYHPVFSVLSATSLKRVGHEEGGVEGSLLDSKVEFAVTAFVPLRDTGFQGMMIYTATGDAMQR